LASDGGASHLSDEWRIPRGVVLVGAAIGGSAFLVFNWFFIPPRGTLRIGDPVNWLVLLPFLVAAVLLTQFVRATRNSHRRAEADRLKDALLAAVSHDLRTPLTTIKALAHDLGALGDERSQVIEEQADRLNRYVAQLLDLSRINAGAMPVAVEVNAVDEILSALIEEVEGRLAPRPLDVQVDDRDGLLLGRFDLLLSVRILANLVDNAHKHSPDGTPVEVRASKSGHLLHFAVLDRGPGISPDRQAALFTPFTQEAPSAPGAGSAGVGLALARRMAELQGGRLVYRDRVGGGAEFELTLPAAGLSDASRAAEAAREFAES
jgi:two-component system sensor histidine kinase KdpD